LPKREAEEKKKKWQGSSFVRSMGINDLEAGSPDKKNRFLELAGDFDAKNLGDRIFNGLTEGRQTSIVLENFIPYFDTEAEAMAAFNLFDVNGDGSIHQPELAAVIMRSFREKRALIAALNDLNSVVEHLNRILYWFSGFATFLAALPILGISFASVVSLSSLFLGLSFIFGNTAKSTFDAIVFIFVHHPFDAGDRVFIDEKNYVVHEMGLLFTSFNEAGKIVYIPNAVLLGKVITNVRRSGNMVDFIKVELHL
jgi:Mechanosensitive ion channel